MRLRPSAIALVTVAALTPAAAALAAPRVVADIAPIQSIAARVMQGVGAPEGLLPPGASPHDYALRPSEARRLQDADLVIWVGPALTNWLAQPIETLATRATVLTLEDLPGMHTLPARAGGPFEAHDHHDEAGAGHDDHDAAEAGHAPHDETAEAPGAEDHNPDHDHNALTIDAHLWLDPDNAVVAARAIAATLTRLDPDDAAAYTANAEAFAAEMATLSDQIAADVAPLRGKRFIVFHDAYQYFENRFDLPAAGSISLHEGAEPGTARVAAIRDRVRTEDIVCAFTEPEFSPRLLQTVIEGTDVRTGELDALGTHVEPGPGLYPTMMTGLAHGLTACLAP